MLQNRNSYKNALGIEPLPPNKSYPLPSSTQKCIGYLNESKMIKPGFLIQLCIDYPNIKFEFKIILCASKLSSRSPTSRVYLENDMSEDCSRTLKNHISPKGFFFFFNL